MRYAFVNKSVPQAKIFIRTLLFSTGKRGRAIESLYLLVSDAQRQSEFSFWGVDDKGLMRGSGLFGPETGISANRHFNPLDAGRLFLFEPGTYSSELKAKVFGTRTTISLWKIPLEVPQTAFGAGITRDAIVHFNWSTEQSHYIASLGDELGQV